MQATIITIGDEILIGQIIDTNSAHIAKEFNKIGISIYQITSVQDDKNHILQALAEAEKTTDIIIITGGLGPTKDDITKHTLCHYFDDKLIQNDEVLAHIQDLFAKYITTPISDSNRKQALLPSKATILKNKYGTASGMWFQKNKKVFISLPGVPFEMKALMHNQVLPKLQKQFNRPFIIHKTILTYGLGESAIADKIENWENNLPKFIKLAYLPNLGKVRLRLTAKGTNKNNIITEINKQITTLHQLIGDIIYGMEEENTIEFQTQKLFTKKKKTLATAESCTGGNIAKLLTSISGASTYFKGSVVSYTTQTKIDVLQVDETIITKNSVVSAAVAEAMAANAQKLLKTDFAIATTGNAGPTKGDSDAQVGTVYIAIATPTHVFSEKFMMGNHREKVIHKTTHKALELLQKEIVKC